MGRMETAVGGIGAMQATVSAMDKQLGRLESKVDAGFESVNENFRAMDQKFESKFDRLESKVDAGFESVNENFGLVNENLREIGQTLRDFHAAAANTSKRLEKVEASTSQFERIKTTIQMGVNVVMACGAVVFAIIKFFEDFIKAKFFSGR